MDVIPSASAEEYNGTHCNSSNMTPHRKSGNRRTQKFAPTSLDHIEAADNLRASISSGIGVGRIKQSQTNVSTSRHRAAGGLLTQPTTSPDGSQKNLSPKGNLFKKNKESLESMLVRKLKQKYIDSNPAFALISNNTGDESLSTCNLLQNNYLTS